MVLVVFVPCNKTHYKPGTQQYSHTSWAMIRLLHSHYSFYLQDAVGLNYFQLFPVIVVKCQVGKLSSANFLEKI